MRYLKKQMFIVILLSVPLFNNHSVSAVEMEGNKYLLNASPCKMNEYAEPQAREIDGCYKATCVGAKDDYRVCKCVTEEVKDFSFLLYHKDKQTGKWPASAYMGDDSDYEVLSYDLDSNGSDELIVANRASTSNGIAISYWEISIVQTDAAFKPPLQFMVEDYGKGTFLQLSKSNTCSILTTEWISAKSPQGNDGLYLAGRLFHYKTGTLEPIANIPNLTRRYLGSFKTERFKTLSDNFQGAPLLWLNNAKTGMRQVDPFFDRPSSRPVAVKNAIIHNISTQVDSESGFPTRYLEIKLDAGESVLYKLYAWHVGFTKFNRIDKIGINKSGKLFPPGYEPEDMPQWLKNSKAQLSTYVDENKTGYNVLWIK